MRDEHPLTTAFIIMIPLPALFRRPAARALASALATALLAAGHASAQHAAPRQHYSIPAGPLSSSLTRFATEAGVPLSVNAALVAQHRSTALDGSYDVEEGFARLLAGTGLAAQREPNGTWVLRAVERQGETTLGVVQVTSTHAPESAGTRNIGRETLGALAGGNRDIGTALRVLPSIQFDNNQFHTGRQGELAPAEVSIHGAKFYDNQFRFDGMSISSDIDPVASNPNNNSTPSSSSQGLAIDTSLLCNIKVHDSNVSAEYGRFSGGVIEAETCAPQRDFGGSLSLELARSSWMNYKLTDAQKESYGLSTSDSQQREFDKKIWRLSLEGRPSENLGLIASVVRKRSEIPLKAYDDGYVSPGDSSRKKETRSSDNYYLRGFWTLAPDVDADFAFSHAPSDDKHFIANTRDSEFRMISGGHGINLGLSHRHDAVRLSHRLQWNHYESSRDADNTVFKNWRYSDEKNWGRRTSASWNSSEGGYGDVEQAQNTLSYLFKAEWEPFELAGIRHTLRAGMELSRQERYYERKTEYVQYNQNTAAGRNPNTSSCMTANGTIDTETCSMARPWNGAAGMGQYMNSRIIHYAGKFDVDSNGRSFFIEDDMRLAPTLRLRLGARYDGDSLAPESTLSPRSALFWDLRGDGTTRLEAGLNRYYSRNFMTYYTTAKRLSLQTEAHYRRVVGGVISDWDTPVQSGTWQFYRDGDIKVPYSDEKMLAFNQQWGGFDWGLKYVKRESRDEVVIHYYREGSNIRRRWENLGRTDSNTLSLTMESVRPLRFAGTESSLLFSIDRLRSETSHNDYEDTFNDSSADPRRQDSERLVRYDGKFIQYRERPVDNFARPHAARLLLNTSIPAARLDIGNLFTWRGSYRKFVRNGSADYNGIAVDNYDLHTFGSAISWDMRINYAIPTRDGQEAFVALSIDNVLDRANAIEDSGSETVYEKGRQVWVEFGYRF